MSESPSENPTYGNSFNSGESPSETPTYNPRPTAKSVSANSKSSDPTVSELISEIDKQIEDLKLKRQWLADQQRKK